MGPLQMCMATSRNLASIPSSFVPKGGFMTIRSMAFGLILIFATSALISSKLAPSTFSYSCS